jgi:hypothetical protein
MWLWSSRNSRYSRIVRKNRNQFRGVRTVFITNAWKVGSLAKTLTPLKSAFHTNSTISCSYTAMSLPSLRAVLLFPQVFSSFPFYFSLFILLFTNFFPLFPHSSKKLNTERRNKEDPTPQAGNEERFYASCWSKTEVRTCNSTVGTPDDLSCPCLQKYNWEEI